MRHIFVETNWVVDWASPAHHQTPAAAKLLMRAEAGETAPPPVDLSLRGSQSYPRQVPAAQGGGRHPTVPAVLDVFESTIKNQLDGLLDSLDSLRGHAGVTVFPLDEEMFARVAELSQLELDLQPCMTNGGSGSTATSH